MKQQPARRRSRIDRERAVKNAEIAAASTEFLDKAEQRNHSAAEPIEPPDDETIASPQMGQGRGKPRAIVADPRCLVLEDSFATGGSEGIALEIEVLIPGREASITNQHVPGTRVLKTCGEIRDRT